MDLVLGNVTPNLTATRSNHAQCKNYMVLRGSPKNSGNGYILKDSLRQNRLI